MIDLLAPRGAWANRAPIADLFDATGDCWDWLASKNPKGYGQVRHDEKTWQAHRLVWTALVGPIPDGMVVDHMCRNRGCVNPDHLRLVTWKQNTLENSVGVAAKHAVKTHCNQGHPLSGDNLSLELNGKARRCVTCRRIRTGVPT